jgi:hypothetical protein
MATYGESNNAWSEIIRVAFPNNKRIKAGRPRVITKTDTGAPVKAEPVGTLCWNEYDSYCYICTVASGTWVKINA